MKNVWKWVLGIVLILIVAAGLFGLGFIHHTQMMAQVAPGGAANLPGWHGPMLRGEFRGGPGMMQMRGFDGGPRRGGMFFGMFRGLIPLALGLLLLYGVYRLGMRKTPRQRSR